MARRTYTDDEKTAALALYAEEGPSVVQERMGIPKGTVCRWAKASDIGTVSSERNAAAVAAARVKWDERRLVMVHEMGDVAALALTQCRNAMAGIEGHVSPRDAKDCALTMAILVDKAQLLSGAATERHESHVHQATKDAVLEEARERALTLVPRIA